LELLHSYGVIAKPTTIKNPQANAFVERIQQIIGNSIRTMELHKRKYDDTTVNAIHQNVAYSLQATYHSSLAASPGQIIFGCDMIINAIYLANWKDLQARRQTQVRTNKPRENKSQLPHQYVVGDSVYIPKSNIEQKLNPLQGPFFIEKTHTNGTVTIRLSPTVSERINICRLHPASTRSNWGSECRTVNGSTSTVWL
jgi:hypothetical protein